MRDFLLIIGLGLTLGCSRPHVGTPSPTEVWLRSLDPGAEVIEVWCTGNVERSPGSEKWRELRYSATLSASDVLAVTKDTGLAWEKIVELMIAQARQGFHARALEVVDRDLAAWQASTVCDPKHPKALELVSEGLTAVQRLAVKVNLRVEDLRCAGKPLRSPPNS